jgi:hypothetical protein
VRASFVTTADSMMTVFILLTGDNWYQIMVDVIRQQKSMVSPIIFFFLVIVIGNYMLLNLFLAILLKFISDSGEVQPEK